MKFLCDDDVVGNTFWDGGTNKKRENIDNKGCPKTSFTQDQQKETKNII